MIEEFEKKWRPDVEDNPGGRLYRQQVGFYDPTTAMGGQPAERYRDLFYEDEAIVPSASLPPASECAPRIDSPTRSPAFRSATEIP